MDMQSIHWLFLDFDTVLLTVEYFCPHELLSTRKYIADVRYGVNTAATHSPVSSYCSCVEKEE